MDVCEVKRLNPFSCGIFEHKKAVSWDIKNDFCTAAGAVDLHFAYDVAGNMLDKCILEFDRTGYEKSLVLKQSHVFSFNKIEFTVTPVKLGEYLQPKQKSTEKESKVLSKYTRRFKQFSGITPPASGECSITEWVPLALDLLENDRRLEDWEKFYILRNSLTRNALTLVSTSVKHGNPRLLIKLISQSYGYEHTCTKLEYDFYKVEQDDLEKPSALWARLQQLACDLKRHDSELDIQKVVFTQFKWALCAVDLDILNPILDLDSIERNKSWPDYAEFLERLQIIELNKDERKSRSTHRRVRSALVSVDLQQGACCAHIQNNASAIPPTVLPSPQTPVVVPQPQPQLNVQTPAADVVVNPIQLTDTHRDDNKHQQPQQRKKFRKKKERKLVCYNCDTEGHRSNECPHEFNADVQRKRFETNLKKKSSHKESSN